MEDYGRMMFLIASFTAVWGVIDLGSSSIFFSLVSQKFRSIRFVNIFWCWILFQFIIVFFLVALVIPEEVIEQIWIHEDKGLLICAMVYSFIQSSVWNNAARLAECV